MIQVAYARIRELTPIELARLPADEREREFENGDRRRQFFCGRWLLRTMLERRGHQLAARRDVNMAEHGKPFINGGPPFSIAHAGDLVACCTADSGDVGIDLEFTDSERNIEGVAKRYFSADEVEWLAAQPEDRFFMLWVLKESWVKALGLSIFGNMDEPRFRVDPPEIAATHDEGRARNQVLFGLDNAYFAIAASDRLPNDIVVERWEDTTDSFVTDDKAQLVART